MTGLTIIVMYYYEQYRQEAVEVAVIQYSEKTAYHTAPGHSTGGGSYAFIV